MTDQTPYPPPPPAPRLRRAPLLLAAVGLAAASVTATLALTASGPAEPERTTATAPSASPMDELRQWVADYGARSAAVISIIEGYSGDIAYYAGQGDLLEVLSLCRDGARYMSEAALEPLSLAPNAPAEWTRMLVAYERGMSACADGDLELSTSYIADGTQAMRDLTDRLRLL